MSETLCLAIADLKRDEAIANVRDRAQKREDPLAILAECRRGMTLVGERFKSGDYFLADLLISAEIFKETVAILEPHLAEARASEVRGKVVLATLKGDIHDLGKNILATLLRAQAFEVHDLGVNVEPARLVEKVEEIRPDFVGFSALIATAFASMRTTANLLREAGLRDDLELMIGGGVTTPEVRDYVGADFQSLDATEGVSYCIERIEAVPRESRG
jgi:methylmalonyl-CoA mutase cobalamin-binding domain/chain